MIAIASPRWKPVWIAVLAACTVAALGGALTDTGDWYRALRKPAWQPPDALFGPAWTLIYGCTVAAGVLAWRHAPDARARNGLMWLFALNAFLNVLWSALFFHFRRPDWALYEVGLLWLSILWLALRMRPWCVRAALLLLPYLVWVAFAGLLNRAVVDLNPA